MTHIKTRKIQTKAHPSHGASSHARTNLHRRERQESETLMRGLDALIAHAESTGLGTAARIFYSAREELVHWAVAMNFHESAEDRFVNQRLYDNRLAAAQAFILRAIRDKGTQADMLGLLGLPKLAPQARK